MCAFLTRFSAKLGRQQQEQQQQQQGEGSGETTPVPLVLGGDFNSLALKLVADKFDPQVRRARTHSTCWFDLVCTKRFARVTTAAVRWTCTGNIQVQVGTRSCKKVAAHRHVSPAAPCKCACRLARG